MNCKRSLRKGDRGPNCTDFRQLDAAVAEAKLAEQIILAVGIDQSVTGAKTAMLYEKCSFYQDRLGANMGTTQKEVRFSQARDVTARISRCRASR